MKPSKRLAITLALATSALLTLTGSALAAPPANDNYADAIPLLNAVATAGSNVEATEEASETAGGRGAGASKGVWYKLNTTGSGKLNVSACPDLSFDGVVDIFTGSSVSSLTLRGWADSSPCDTITPLYFTSSQEIYIRVSGYSGNEGGFSVTASLDAAAANDNFANAQLVTGDSVTETWDNTNSGTEVGEPNISNAASTLWYKWTPDANGWATFSTCPDLSFDTVVGVFTGSSVDALSTVGTADSGCDNGGSKTSALAVSGGTTYYVQVAGYGGVVGTSPLSIEYEAVPDNETVATATNLGNAAGVHITADNRYATDAAESGEPVFKGSQRYKSVWFKWTSPVTGDVTFDACGDTSGSDGILGVFSNSAAPTDPGPSDLAPLTGGSGDGDDNCTPSNGMGTMVRPVTSGTMYWIGVANYGSGNPGRTFNLNISTAAFNTAIPVISGADRFVGTELSTTDGSWAGEAPITYTYAWDRCEEGVGCNPIAGAEDSTYTLTVGDVGYTVRARVTGQNGAGSDVGTSAETVVIDADDDSDGFGNADDSCPANANGAGKTNGCPIEEISIDTAPSVSGTAQVGSTLTLAIGTASNNPGLDSGVAAATSTIYWYSCSSATIIGSCATRSGTGTTYAAAANDIGRFIRSEVAWANDDGSTASSYSVATAAVVAAPVVVPPANNTPPQTTPPQATPPAPTNPLSLAVKKSLGKITPKKGVATLKGAVVTCAASATGPCTGTVTLSVKVKKKLKKFVTAKISIAPGKSSPVTIKLSKGQLKAIKKAKSLKVTAAFSVAGPGFTPLMATASATLKPQK